jgi:hypothetical protein
MDEKGKNSMSSSTYKIPWTEGKIRSIDVSVTVEQGQLIDAAGVLATKGDTDADSGKKARYIAAASVTTSGRIGVYQNAVVDVASFASGTAGDDIYLGAAGTYTLVAPLVGDSDISQVIGFLRPDLRGQINLENTTATVLS